MFRSPSPRPIQLLVLVACASAQAAVQDLARERAWLDESRAALEASDYGTARAKAAEAVAALLARPAAEQDASSLELLFEAGRWASAAEDARTARDAFQRVYDVRLRTLSEDDYDLQRARAHLAVELEALGDFAGAKAMFEGVLEGCLRTMPEDDPQVQVVRSNLAATMKSIGDLAGARALEEQVLEVLARTLPDDDPQVLAVRGNLAVSLLTLGDLRGARELLEQVLDVQSRTLPDDHPHLQLTRGNLASTLADLGDLDGARALQEKVLEVNSRTLPGDHPSLQAARSNLASTRAELGDVRGAQALYEQVLDALSRTLPDEHPDVLTTRINLAAARRAQGDLAGTRAQLEKAYEVRSRTLPDDHPALQTARLELAGALHDLGDLSGARALLEKVLQVQSSTLPDDHPDLQRARLRLAGTIADLGDLPGARAMEEKVLEVRSRILKDDHPDLLTARANLALTLSRLGDLDGARALQEKVLELHARDLPEDHLDLQTARANLAGTLEALGDLDGARALQEQALEVLARKLPEDHRDLQMARGNLAVTIGKQVARAGSGAAGERRRCAQLVGAMCRALLNAARAAILESPAREAEERCANLATYLQVPLSFAQGYGAFEPIDELLGDAFALAETTRGAALASADLARGAARSPEYRELRDALASSSEDLARLAQQGTTGEEFDRARTRREAAERALVAAARESAGGASVDLAAGADALAARLAESEAAVGFRRYLKRRVEVGDGLDASGRRAVREIGVEHLGAFVVRSARAGATSRPILSLVDLGPIAPIESAAHAWRDAIGVGQERGLSLDDSASARVELRGEELRRLVLDPLLPALGEVGRVVVALDDVLHLVPLDALPAAATGGAGELVGDRWRIETRSTLAEILAVRPAPAGTALVALGGASFNAVPVALSAEESAPIGAAEPVPAAAESRGRAWERGFAPLTHSGDEARGIGALYREVHEDERPAIVLEKRKASRAALEELAPKARWLHVATHGWYAPESIRSWSDPEPIDRRSGLGVRLSGEEQVKGMSPMLLCGLALAGANLPEDAAGRAPGLVTAEELSTLDLSGCELAVLSACDTNVGLRRAGQGVASLQKALHIAGARSVITSLWKVPDEATKELMLDFYRRLWVEGKPKGQALWEAKRMLRNAKDERELPRYTTRDWAAWVLTGDPR